MLLATRDEPFDSEAYLFEIKWDGYRCLAVKERGVVRLVSRRSHDLSANFPEVATALAGLAGDFVLDGELTVLRDGRDDFAAVMRRARLQIPASIKKAALACPATYIAFDILQWQGQDVAKRPLTQRKEILLAAVQPSERVVVNPWVDGQGKALFAVAVARGYEGIVAKKKDSPYVPGARVSTWLKIKHWREKIVSIVGCKLGRDFALMVADDEGASTLVRAGLGPVEREAFLSVAASMFVRREGEMCYLPPLLKCVVKYKETTAQGRLRHPIFVRFCLPPV